MKKRVLVLLLSIFLTGVCFSEGKPLVFSAGISSGYPFYGSNKMRLTNDYISITGGRFIIGTNALLELNLLKQLSLFAGTDFLCDFNSNSVEWQNTMDLSFNFGCKFYPGLGGFAVGLGYTLGTRFDFIQLFPEIAEFIQPDLLNSAWGNGIKVLVEYNFSHQSELPFMPTLGISWRLMPRGNWLYDNILTAYLMINI